jgi:hypothetical protein
MASVVGANPVNPGQLGPTGIVIGPLPAMSMPGQFAGATPTMANFQYLLAQIQNIVTGTTPVAPYSLTVESNGAIIQTGVNLVNFTGAGQSATNAGPGAVNVNITGGGAGSAWSFYDEGSLLTNNVSSVNAVGSAVTATNVGGAVTLTVTGGGSGATLQGQEFTASGTFTPPANVTSLWVTMIGAGGGGATNILAASGGGGGGAGELIANHPVICVAGSPITVTIGAKGTGGVAAAGSAQPGTDGGNSSFGSVIIANGGKGAAVGTNGASGGGFGGKTGVAGIGGLGVAEATTYFGGSSSGGGGTTTTTAGFPGGGAGGYTGGAGGATASTQAGGGGGASTVYGVGGAGGAGGSIGVDAAVTSYGAGGGGGGGHVTTTVGGGAGCAGYCLVQWVS